MGWKKMSDFPVGRSMNVMFKTDAGVFEGEIKRTELSGGVIHTHIGIRRDIEEAFAGGRYREMPAPTHWKPVRRGFIETIRKMFK